MGVVHGGTTGGLYLGGDEPLVRSGETGWSLSSEPTPCEGRDEEVDHRFRCTGKGVFVVLPEPDLTTLTPLGPGGEKGWTIRLQPDHLQRLPTPDHKSSASKPTSSPSTYKPTSTMEHVSWQYVRGPLGNVRFLDLSPSLSH